MDKLRLFTAHYAAIPKHVLTSCFVLYKEPTVIKGTDLKIYYWYDYQRGVHIVSSPSGISIETNPTRFLKGHNLYQINRVELLDFVSKFNDTYSSDFSNWNVSLFDYNNDIQVDHAPSRYFAMFGGLKKWDRTPYETGINYVTTSNTKALTFYDLGNRCKVDKKELPHSPNTIRIEASFNKMLPTIKELKNMRTLEDYTETDNYRQLPRLWLNSYEAVEKNETVDHIPDLTKKEVEILDKIQRLTVNGYRDKLKIDYPAHHRYHFNQLENLLQKMRDHRQKHNLLGEVDELNKKVRERAKQLILAA